MVITCSFESGFELYSLVRLFLTFIVVAATSFRLAWLLFCSLLLTTSQQFGKEVVAVFMYSLVGTYFVRI